MKELLFMRIFNFEFEEARGVIYLSFDCPNNFEVLKDQT